MSAAIRASRYDVTILWLPTLIFMRQASLGIQDQRAPEWNVATWFNTGPAGTPLRLADITSPVVYLYCFQAWCPGCHSHGFPTMTQVRERFGGGEVTFVAVQTVFEGHNVNTADRAVAAAAQHGLGGIPIGHDPGVDGGRPNLMTSYRTGGTPWTVIIGPERRVCLDGFQVDADAAVAIIGQLLS